MEASDPNSNLRDQAVKSLNAKHDFMTHLATYAGVSVLLVLIWLLTGTDNFFWPAIPIVAWGIFGIIPNYWTAYRQSGLPEDKIQAEMEKIQRENGPGA